MSLASHLLKHLVIAKYCNVSWSDAKISRTTNGKPCYIPSVNEGNERNHVTFDFNVSHQAGIVSLIAAVGFKGHIDTGTDVVCMNEREDRDVEYVQKSGFFDWVDMHGEVFAESEINFMKLGSIGLSDLGFEGELLGSGEDALSRCQWRDRSVVLKVQSGDREENIQVDTNRVIDVKMRRFYAMWCLRETYVKMTGDALLAPWLKQLQISGVQVPAARESELNQESLDRGGVHRNFQIIFEEMPVTDVTMELSALGRGFMVGGALRVTNTTDQDSVVMGSWQELNLENDILTVAEKNP